MKAEAVIDNTADDIAPITDEQKAEIASMIAERTESLEDQEAKAEQASQIKAEPEAAREEEDEMRVATVNDAIRQIRGGLLRICAIGEGMDLSLLPRPMQALVKRCMEAEAEFQAEARGGPAVEEDDDDGITIPEELKEFLTVSEAEEIEKLADDDEEAAKLHEEDEEDDDGDDPESSKDKKARLEERKRADELFSDTAFD